MRIAENCWSEYAASSLSAETYPDHGRLYEKTFVATLRQFRERILAVKREWGKDQDYEKAWKRVPTDVAAVLRYASYLMGHIAGLNEVFEEYAKEAWLLMQENAWLLPRFEEQYAALAEMMNSFEQWKGLEAFDHLKEIARHVFEDCGITMCQLPDGTVRFWIGDGKLPT